MNYVALFSILIVSQFANANPNTPLSQIKSVDVQIHNRNVGRSAKDAKFELNVFINGYKKENFAATFTVSPGALIDNPKKGKEPELTPEGTFHPTRLERDYVSKQFGGKILGIFETGAMPYTIFFYNGFAIHGSAATVDGKPASKGCVRLRKANAKKLFDWVTAAINNSGSNKSVKIHIYHTESEAVKNYRREK
jgi:hypothetical protein